MASKDRGVEFGGKVDPAAMNFAFKRRKIVKNPGVFAFVAGSAKSVLGSQKRREEKKH